MSSLLKSAWIIAIVSLVCLITIEMDSRAGDCEVSQTASPISTPCDDCAVNLYMAWKCDTEPSPVAEECGGSTNVDGIVCTEDSEQCSGTPTTYQDWGFCLLDVGGIEQEEDQCYTYVGIADAQDNGDEPYCPLP